MHLFLNAWLQESLGKNMSNPNKQRKNDNGHGGHLYG